MSPSPSTSAAKTEAAASAPVVIVRAVQAVPSPFVFSYQAILSSSIEAESASMSTSPAKTEEARSTARLITCCPPKGTEAAKMSGGRLTVNAAAAIAKAAAAIAKAGLWRRTRARIPSRSRLRVTRITASNRLRRVLGILEDRELRADSTTDIFLIVHRGSYNDVILLKKSPFRIRCPRSCPAERDGYVYQQLAKHRSRPARRDKNVGGIRQKYEYESWNVQ